MKSLLFAISLAAFYAVGVSSSDLSRNGSCPLVKESDHDCNRKFLSECLLDFDCNQRMKCCRTACHQYKCVQPLKDRVCQKYADIAFVLDASGSIGGESFQNMKDIIKELLNSFSHERGNRHATIVYGQKPSIVFNNIAEWKKNVKTADLLKMVDKIPYYNSPMTRINAALHLAQRKIFHPHGYRNKDQRIKMIVLFTDGIQSTPPYQEGLIEAGKVLDKNDIKVFGVLTGEQINMNALLHLCTNDQFIFQPEFVQELIKVMNRETEYFC